MVLHARALGLAAYPSLPMHRLRLAFELAVQRPQLAPGLADSAFAAIRVLR